jgi:DNA-binding transcriptional LysR family regulator
MTLRKKLPSAQSLFAFEAAASTLNFTAAGHSLNVTQPAISKSIHALEAHLGVKLFIRHKSGMQLTEAGKTLHRAAKLSFETLETAIDRIKQQEPAPNTLSLSVSTAFAAHWLIPKMESFKQTFPDVVLNFQLTASEVTGPVAPCDLGIRLETEVSNGEHATPFCPEWVIPVASPDYIAQNGPLDRPTPSAQHSIVKMAQPRLSWDSFLDQTGQRLPQEYPEIRVPDYSVVLQTALNGRGVALGFATSSGYLIQQGLLVQALPYSLDTGKSYCIVTAKSDGIPPLVQQVKKWIIQHSNTIQNHLEETIPIYQQI